MANYYCTARSNYFRVKDDEKFLDWVDSHYGIGVWTSVKPGDRSKAHELGDDYDGPTYYAIFDDGGDACGFPSWDMDKDEEIDIFAELSEHLAEDSVAIIMEAGAEKMRYVCGYAWAVNSEGEVLRIMLSDIYDLAKEAWDGCEITAAEY